ncbi:nuclear transport factor 2 family protein [Actinoallomurus sp. NPDC052274]|uniref:nuclear transport factor 2 family protein n=1 Tax=Actinoallomurus sp. NPDC052274 TaxID=3155420 RepID=UPI0034468A09
MISSIVPNGYFGSWEKIQTSLSADDQLACLNLVARFEWCFDARNFDALAGMLTDDFVLDHVWGYREGRDAALALLREKLPINDGLRHASLNPTVYGEEDGTAVALSYLLGVLVGEDAGGPQRPIIAGEGVRVDRFRKENGVWRMTACAVDQMWVHSSFPIPDAERAHYRLNAAERPTA